MVNELRNIFNIILEIFKLIFVHLLSAQKHTAQEDIFQNLASVVIEIFGKTKVSA